MIYNKENNNVIEEHDQTFQAKNNLKLVTTPTKTISKRYFCIFHESYRVSNIKALHISDI